MNDVVYDVAVGLDGRVYAGGVFTTAGGVAANYIAVWDGISWSELGGGANSTVRALAIGPDGRLYVAGLFTTVGTTAANYIAVWDGLMWEALGNGLSAAAYVLAVASDGLLYAGGQFTSAGDLALTDRVAAWNGYTWLQLDVDLPGVVTVYGLCVGDYGVVYVGFNTSGTAAVSSLRGILLSASTESYPSFWMLGQATLSTIINETTGQDMRFDVPVLVGETVTVSTGPGEAAVISSWGRRISGQPRPGSDFAGFYLHPGYNAISTFALSAAAGARMGISYRNRYHGFESGDVL
jgi:hypothetical protein